MDMDNQKVHDSRLWHRWPINWNSAKHNIHVLLYIFMGHKKTMGNTEMWESTSKGSAVYQENPVANKLDGYSHNI